MTITALHFDDGHDHDAWRAQMGKVWELPEQSPPSVRIRRVMSVRSAGPVVLATVDGAQVRWQPRDGWTCKHGCDITRWDCLHITAVLDVLADDVLDRDGGP